MATINFINILKCISILIRTSTYPKSDWFHLANSILKTIIKNPNSVFNRKSNESKKHFLTDYLEREIIVKSPDGLIFLARPKFEDFARFLFSKILAKWEPIYILKPKKDQIIIDVGANVGYYAIYLAKIVGKNGRVVAIEPDPYSFKTLKKNCELNNLTNVEFYNLAISDHNGSLSFYQEKSHSGKSSLFSNSAENISIKVLTTSLDELFENKLQTINWLKIDVEGYELLVLKGASKLLSKTQKILIEIHEDILKKQNQKPEELIKILTDSGFKIRTFNEYWDKDNSPNQTLESDYILAERTKG